MSDFVQMVGFVIITIVVMVSFVTTLIVLEQRRKHEDYQSPFDYQLDQQIAIRGELDRVIIETRWFLVASHKDKEMLLNLGRLERWRARTNRRISQLRLLEEQMNREAKLRREQIRLASAA